MFTPRYFLPYGWCAINSGFMVDYAQEFQPILELSIFYLLVEAACHEKHNNLTRMQHISGNVMF